MHTTDDKPAILQCDVMCTSTAAFNFD